MSLTLSSAQEKPIVLHFKILCKLLWGNKTFHISALRTDRGNLLGRANWDHRLEKLNFQNFRLWVAKYWREGCSRTTMLSTIFVEVDMPTKESHISRRFYRIKVCLHYSIYRIGSFHFRHYKIRRRSLDYCIIKKLSIDVPSLPKLLPPSGEVILNREFRFENPAKTRNYFKLSQIKCSLSRDLSVESTDLQ